MHVCLAVLTRKKKQATILHRRGTNSNRFNGTNNDFGVNCIVAAQLKVDAFADMRWLAVQYVLRTNPKKQLLRRSCSSLHESHTHPPPSATAPRVLKTTALEVFT